METPPGFNSHPGVPSAVVCKPQLDRLHWRPIQSLLFVVGSIALSEITGFRMTACGLLHLTWSLMHSECSGNMQCSRQMQTTK